MQGIELVLIVAGVFVTVAYVMVQYLGRTDVAHPGARTVLGVVPGLIGVALVMVSLLDFIPDDIEGPLWAIVIVTVTALAIIGTSYRVARR